MKQWEKSMDLFKNYNKATQIQIQPEKQEQLSNNLEYKEIEENNF